MVLEYDFFIPNQHSKFLEKFWIGSVAGVES